MARLGRLFVPGFPLLVLQRGNNGTPIFLDEVDCQNYRHILRDGVRELGVSLHAYVLMPDHAHLLLSAPQADAVSTLVQRLGRRYVRGFNDRHQRTGTLWEGRYRSTAVQPEAYVLACYRYIELNPQRKGLVADPAAYLWSSCQHHLGLTPDPLISDHPLYWALGNTPFERQARYRSLLEAGSPSKELEAIRHAGYKGWLLGQAPADLANSEDIRRFQPLPKGRPRRNPA
ncbi:transposase [Uliginosibacterium gangwonense]|uniref:transposase n=1 Tax=Uliginosibacterium gangwonense TaxID=392736 RepID=UPI00037BAAAF|nr:transposase [Uliginosibacterium gangwonense]